MAASSFHDVEAIFRRVCGPRRDVHCARTFEDLAGEVEHMNPAEPYGDESGDDPEPDEHLGDIGRPIVAWAYECESPTLAAIHQGASEIGVESLFRRLAGGGTTGTTDPSGPMRS